MYNNNHYKSEPLLLQSGDIETHPGPETGYKLNETEQNCDMLTSKCKGKHNVDNLHLVCQCLVFIIKYMYDTNINETFLHETLALGFDETLRKLIEKSKKAFYLEYYDKLLHVKFTKGKK